MTTNENTDQIELFWMSDIVAFSNGTLEKEDEKKMTVSSVQMCESGRWIDAASKRIVLSVRMQ